MKRFNLNLDSDIKVLLPDGSAHRLIDYLLPSATLMIAALLLMISMFLPYWRMKLYAPQYPNGLAVNVYVNHLEGDMREVDELNHYLGMPILDEGGRLERSISYYGIAVLGLLLIAGVFVHNRWAALIALPAIIYPLIFVADLYLILYQYGHSIDPKSALGGAIKQFTPPLMGLGTIGQFNTFSSFQPGFFFSLAAVAAVFLSLWLHRAAYKPLADARKRVRLAASQPSPAVPQEHA